MQDISFSDTVRPTGKAKKNDFNYIGPIVEEEERTGSNIIIKTDDIYDPGYKMLKSRVSKSKRYDVVTFGNYEQDNDLNDGKEPIEWIILEVTDTKALLVSKYILDCKKFNNTAGNITWEDSDLRRWLNTTFYDEAFRYNEKMIICNDIIENKKNYYYNSSSGNQTVDRVFPLSIEEAIIYFEDAGDFYKMQENALKPNAMRRALGTPYAIQNGLRVIKEDNDYKGCGNYWLRTSGKNENREWYSGIFAKYYEAIVQEPGHINPSGTAVHSGDDGVRPAIWINIS